VTEFLVKQQDTIKSIVENSTNELNTTQVESFFDRLQAIFDEEGNGEPQWQNIVQKIWAMGPKRTGANLLINSLPDYDRHTWVMQGDRSVALFDNSVATGFQMATSSGPLCNEPMHGLAIFVEDINWHTESFDDGQASNSVGVTQGQLITTTRDVIRSAFLARSPRMMLAMYNCEIQCVSESLGDVYGALARRRGRIVSEDIRDGTPYFVVQARLPVVESFGFADDMRKRTSGGASPLLVFAGWDVLDEDPFWAPTTEEEMEDYGNTCTGKEGNVARRYMDAVRKRKGLFVETKIVEHAEKQRTLMKK
jgi:ribosome assembly protein 1